MEEIGNKKGIASSYYNIGLVYFGEAKPEINSEIRKNKIKLALENHFASLKIKESIGNRAGIAQSYLSIGNIYLIQKQFKEAENYFINAKKISQEIGFKENLKDIFKSFAGLDSSTANFKGAYENHKLYILYRDSLDNEETKKKTIQSAMTYEFEKKEIATKAEQDKKDILTAGEAKKQKLVIAFMVIGLFLIIIFTGFVIRSLRFTRKQKNIIEKQKEIVDESNIQLNQQNEEIRTQRDEIEAQRDEITAQRDLVTHQKEHIEEIHQEVTDSINYAKRIQHAMLPDLELGAWNLDFESFILFKPKDVVSGDFYWATRVNEMLVITVADCTGHGVPGAFMSMLGISFLNEIVRKKEVTQASQVLNQLRSSIIDALKQTGSEGTQKDGLDLALVVINTETLECQFAGANNPLWICINCDCVPLSAPRHCKEQSDEAISKETINANNFVTLKTEITPPNHSNVITVNRAIPYYELIEIKPDKMPVAIYDNMKPFSNHIINLCKGDILYLASDGFEDQFGGSRQKKFLSKNMKELLKLNSHKPMAEQKEILETTIINWIGSGEQIDDITVMGIRI